MQKSNFQIFIENLVATLLTLLKVVLFSKLCKKLPRISNNSTCVILGNGPSLKAEAQKAIQILKNYDLWAVNFFWKSELYTALKPKYYVIASKNYWSEGMIDNNREGREQTFNEIARLTEWPMVLLVPSFVKKHKKWRVSLDKNKNISIYYYNLVPIEGFKFTDRLLFKWGAGLPRPHNVLIPSIKLAINTGYSKVLLLGADHSWLKDIYVSDENKVYLTQKHFYDEKTAKAEVMYQGNTTGERNIAQMLQKFMYTFNSYYILNDFANYMGSTIVNATPDSYIDAFKREKVLKDDQKSV